MDETCSLCGGVLEPLGQLGRRVHYQCRSCGMQFSELEDEEGTDERDAADGYGAE